MPKISEYGNELRENMMCILPKAFPHFGNSMCCYICMVVGPPFN